MHMELQWTMWIPWAFWALHRTMTEPTWRSGVLTGLFVALQMLSSIYYGVFLITLLSVSGILLLISLPRERMMASVRALVPGALLAMILCGAYAWPYLLTKSELGGRSDTEVVSFSARPSSYLVATPDNVVWGEAFQSRGRAERRLFPGALAVLLAAVGLLLRPPPKVALVYLLACVLAFDMSLGLSGETYRYLYRYVPVYQGFRALARLGIFVVFFLAVLAAWGFMALAARLSMRGRAILATAICFVLLAEYRVRPMELVPYPNSPPPLYEWLSRQPKGVVAELPMRSELPGDDPMYSYYSTFHWQPIVNGYSGFYPASYTGRLEDVARFPDERSLRRLRQDGVRYLVVHLWAFETEDPQSIARTLHDDFGLAILTQLSDGTGDAIVFGLR
jgi:hypothetical protein